MRARFRLGFMLLGAACFLAIVGVSAASPPAGGSFQFSFVDTQLCAFPLGVSVSGRSVDHVKLAQGTELFTGATTFILQNLDTGATAHLATSGTTDFDYAGGTVTFHGSQLAGQIPFASFTGQIRVSLDDSVFSAGAGRKA
jgi:hypothetical protein